MQNSIQVQMYICPSILRLLFICVIVMSCIVTAITLQRRGREYLCGALSVSVAAW